MLGRARTRQEGPVGQREKATDFGLSHGTSLRQHLIYQRRVPWDAPRLRHATGRRFSRWPLDATRAAAEARAPRSSWRSVPRFRVAVEARAPGRLGGASHGTQSWEVREREKKVPWDNVKRRRFSGCPMGPPSVSASPTSAESHGTLPGYVTRPGDGSRVGPMGPSPVSTSPTSAESHGTLPGYVTRPGDGFRVVPWDLHPSTPHLPAPSPMGRSPFA